MYLKLAIEGKVIASASLDIREVRNLEYLYAKRRMLAEACCDTIALHQQTPVYFIEVASRMNKRSSRGRA